MRCAAHFLCRQDFCQEGCLARKVACAVRKVRRAGLKQDENFFSFFLADLGLFLSAAQYIDYMANHSSDIKPNLTRLFLKQEECILCAMMV